MTLPRLAAIVALAIVLVALHPRAQTPPARPQFRAGTDLVQVDVSVLDKKRHPVRGLTAADFTVTEDGQPREIQAFSEVYLPDHVRTNDAGWVREVPADLATNNTVADEGRLVIILLDRTIPAGEAIVRAKRSAVAAVNQLGPDDLAAVISTSGSATQNLTSDRARLIRAINSADQSAAISAEADAVMAGVGIAPNPFSDGRCLCGLCVLEAITSIADAVQNTPRRRKILFFIGSDLILQSASRSGASDVGCDNRLADARTTMLSAVDRANLTVHSLDPSGLRTVPVAQADLGGAALNARVTLQRQGALSVLPDRTGGRTIANANDPDLQVNAIFRESDSYYLLGFRPGDAGPNRKFHTVTVKTTRRGLDVHARNGYVAGAAVEVEPARPTGDGIAAPLRAAMTGLLPDSGLPLQVNAATFAMPGSNKGTVVLTVAGEAFAAGPGGPADADLEVVAGAFDRGGRSVGVARQSLHLAWPVPAQAPPQRVDLLSKLELPPGEYEVRVGVSGTAPARTASVFTYVTVPAFAATPLSLSSIVLSATAGTLSVPKEFLGMLLPVVPTAQRQFAPPDRFVGFLRIYQGTGRRDPLLPVRLQSSVINAQGQVLAEDSAALDAAQFDTERTAEHYISLPLAGLGAGEYLLRIEAAMGTYTAGRAVRFSVR